MMTEFVLGKHGSDWAYLTAQGPLSRDAVVYSDGVIVLNSYEIGNPMEFIADLEALIEWGHKLFCEEETDGKDTL